MYERYRGLNQLHPIDNIQIEEHQRSRKNYNYPPTPYLHNDYAEKILDILTIPRVPVALPYRPYINAPWYRTCSIFYSS